jgi:hypothetical protein
MKPKVTISTKPLSEVTTTEFDRNSDGIIDGKETITKTYDQQGNIIKAVFEDDTNNDGIIDARSTATNKYDSKGNVIEGTRDSDINPYANNLRLESFKNTYNQQGKLTLSVFKYDYNRDGKADATSTQSNIYDAKGNLTVDLLSFNEIPSIKRLYTYDNKNNITRSIQLMFRPDGINYDTKSEQNNTYDSNGKLIQQISEYDGDGDGITKLVVFSKIPMIRRVT